MVKDADLRFQLGLVAEDHHAAQNVEAAAALDGDWDFSRLEGSTIEA